LLPPGGPWQLVRDWGAGTSWQWDTSGYAPGTYTVFVGVRAVGAASAQASAQLDYTLAGGACTGASLSPDLAAPQSPGAAITFSDSASGCGSAEQRFWLLPPGGEWQLEQDWSSTSSWQWQTSGLAAGTY